MKLVRTLVFSMIIATAVSCSKNELGTGTTGTTSGVGGSMTGRWSTIVTGTFGFVSGTIRPPMQLTETNGTLTGLIVIVFAAITDSIAVSGSVNSSLEVVLSGSDGVYRYDFTGTVNSSKNTLNGKVDAFIAGVTPPATAGSASLSAVKP